MAQEAARRILEAGEVVDTAYWFNHLKMTYPNIIRDQVSFDPFNKMLLMYQQRHDPEITCVLMLAGLYALFPRNAPSIEDDFNFLLAMRLTQSNLQDIYYKYGMRLLKKKFYLTLRYMEEENVKFDIVHLEYMGDFDFSTDEGYNGSLASLIRGYDDTTP